MLHKRRVRARVDQELVAFTADVAHVNDAGGHVSRHNLANDPHAFVDAETVRAFTHVAGSEGLPLTTVDGITVLTGRYPDRAQLIHFAGLGDGRAGSDAPPVAAGLGLAAPLRSLNLIGVSDSACTPESGC